MTKKKEKKDALGRRSVAVLHYSFLFFLLQPSLWITEGIFLLRVRRWRGKKIKNSSKRLSGAERKRERRRGGGVFCAGTNICRKFQLLKQLLAVIVWHVQELSTTGFKQKYKAEINTARGGINLRDVQGRWIKHVLLLLLLCYCRAWRSCYQEAATLTLHLYGKQRNTAKNVIVLFSQIIWSLYH